MNLQSSLLRTFPDLSDQRIEELDVSKNLLRVVSEEFLPIGLRILILDQNYIQSDGLPMVFPDTLEEISMNENCISDFREVDHFPNALRKVSIAKNSLQSLANFTQDTIEELNLEDNHIEWIGYLSRGLQLLNLSKNYLSMLPNRLPTTLRVLNLNSNCLRYAGLPGNWGSALEELSLSDNKIERFPRNLPPTLKILHLNKNRISEVPANFNRLFPSLTVLGLARNKLRSIPLEARYKPISFVNLSENELTIIPSQENEELRSPWAILILEQTNWNTHHHHGCARRIQKNWRASRIQVRIRTWKRIGILREELLCVSMMPERVWETDVLSPEWKRPIN